MEARCPGLHQEGRGGSDDTFQSGSGMGSVSSSPQTASHTETQGAPCRAWEGVGRFGVNGNFIK